MAESIWFQECGLDDLNKHRVNTLNGTLDIEFTEIGPDYVVARMPVNNKTRQPFGIVHGGASVSLAESLGSIAANLVLDTSRFYGVGLEVNANHVRPAADGYVTGTTKPLHIGRKTQVWEIKIRNDQGQLTCISRLTVAILERD